MASYFPAFTRFSTSFSSYVFPLASKRVEKPNPAVLSGGILNLPMPMPMLTGLGADWFSTYLAGSSVSTLSLA